MDFFILHSFCEIKLRKCCRAMSAIAKGSLPFWQVSWSCASWLWRVGRKMIGDFARNCLHHTSKQSFQQSYWTISFGIKNNINQKCRSRSYVESCAQQTLDGARPPSRTDTTTYSRSFILSLPGSLSSRLSFSHQDVNPQPKSAAHTHTQLRCYSSCQLPPLVRVMYMRVGARV